MKQLGGIVPALVTTFTIDGKINESALRALIRLNIQKGVSGFYVTGSSGEAFLLTEEERMHVLDIVADEVAGRCFIISHVGSISTEQAIRFAIHAKDAGADALSAIPPFYYGFTFDEIRQYYADIAQAADMPLIAYNFPKLSGVTLTPENIADLRRDRHIIGIKHTSMDLYALERMKTNDPALLVFCGHDEILLGGLSMGADGAIGTTYNFMSEKFLSIAKLFKEGLTEDARAVQADANRIIAGLIRVGVFQGTKYMLSKMGIDCGECRRPFKKLTQEDRDLLDELFKLYLRQSI